MSNGTGTVVPIGTIMAYAGDLTNPTNVNAIGAAGWLYCNGTLYDNSTYPSLFSLIGTSFGGNSGSSQFCVPDLRGLFIRGLDNGRSLDADASLRKASRFDNSALPDPGNLGATVGSRQDDAPGPHLHPTGCDAVDYHGLAYPPDAGNPWQVPQFMQNYTGNAATPPGGGSWPTGNSDVRPKNIALSYIIYAGSQGT